MPGSTYVIEEAVSLDQHNLYLYILCTWRCIHLELTENRSDSLGSYAVHLKCWRTYSGRHETTLVRTLGYRRASAIGGSHSQNALLAPPPGILGYNHHTTTSTYSLA